MALLNPSHAVAVPRGSLVLVTGASGYIASHTIMSFLQHGYRIRGTVRNRAKAAFLSEGEFAKYASFIELVDVPDMAAEGAFDEAMRGVDVVVNIASDLSLNTDPDQVIPAVVASVQSLLRRAAAEPSVKRFVHCSTISTVYYVDERTDDFSVLDQTSWNEIAVKEAYAPPPHDPLHGLTVYAASKVKAEQAAWEFVKNEKPGFAFNTIHPFCVLGSIYTKAHLSGTPGWLLAVYNGQGEFPERVPMAHVDVKDVAVLHLAAALDPDLENQRILAWAEKFNWNTVLAMLRRMYPERKFRDDIPGVQGQMGQTYDDSLPLSLLRKWGGRSGWIPLEETVRETIETSR